MKKLILLLSFFILSLSTYSNIKDSICIKKYNEKVVVTSKVDVIGYSIYKVGDCEYGNCIYYRKELLLECNGVDVNEFLLDLSLYDNKYIIFIEIKTVYGVYWEKLTF